MCGVFSLALLYPIPYIPALGDKARIIYFHVPTAWTTVIAFLTSLFYGIKYLRTRNLEYDVKASSAASLGFLFCILATVTGAVWARFNWGSFWNWDPRQTSIFMLLLIYGAYFAFRSSLDEKEKRARLSSVYCVLAGVTVPFFVFIMPRIVESLHPDPIINAQGKINMDTSMLLIFLSSLLGFTGIFVWLLRMKVKLGKLDLSASGGTEKAN